MPIVVKLNDPPFSEGDDLSYVELEDGTVVAIDQPHYSSLQELKQSDSFRQWCQSAPLREVAKALRVPISEAIKLRQKPSKPAIAVADTFDAGDLLTVEELAQKMKVPVGWIREKTRKRSQNPLPSIPLGRYIRYFWPDVCAWVMAQKR